MKVKFPPPIKGPNDLELVQESQSSPTLDMYVEMNQQKQSSAWHKVTQSDLRNVANEPHPQQ